MKTNKLKIFLTILSLALLSACSEEKKTTEENNAVATEQQNSPQIIKQTNTTETQSTSQNAVQTISKKEQSRNIGTAMPVNKDIPALDKKLEKPKDNPYKDAKIETKPVKNEDGTWGYELLLEGNLYIKQPHIPAINGNRGFKNDADAKKVGDLMAYKVRNNIMPPSVTPQELDSLGVLK